MEQQQWRVTRWVLRYRIAILMTLAVLVACAGAFTTGYASWGHIVSVGVKAGEGAANVLPVSIDGTMVIGAILSAVDRIRGYKPRTWAVICLWLGASLTLTYNIASAWDRGVMACLIASTYAVSFLAMVEAITRGSKKTIEVIAAVKAAMTEVKTIDPASLPGPIAATMAPIAFGPTAPPAVSTPPVVTPAAPKPRRTAATQEPRKRPSRAKPKAAEVITTLGQPDAEDVLTPTEIIPRPTLNGAGTRTALVR